jgi:AcrR family transcriptional regulator
MNYVTEVTKTPSPRTPGEPATPRGEATRAAILENSARLFAQKGYEGTSFQDIAEAMNLTRQSVYHYFRSKEELLATLVAETTEIAADRLTAIRHDNALMPTQKLQQMTAEIVQERLDFPERFRMLERSESALPEPVAGQHRAARRTVLNEVKAVITEGIITGEFRECDARLGALSLLGMCNWIAWWYHPGSPETPEQIIRNYLDTARAMFAQPGSLSPEPGVKGALAQVRRELDRMERMLDDLGCRGDAPLRSSPCSRQAATCNDCCSSRS